MPLNQTTRQQLQDAITTIRHYADEWFTRELILTLESIQPGNTKTYEVEYGQERRDIRLPDAFDILKWVKRNAPQVANGTPLPDIEYVNMIAMAFLEEQLADLDGHTDEIPPIGYDAMPPLHPEVGRRPNGTLCTMIPEIAGWLSMNEPDSYSTKPIEVLEVTYTPTK